MLDTMATEMVRRRRRHYSAELKEQILLECAQPGASVAKVAMAHGINANIVHGWRKLARETNALVLPAPSFVPVTVAAESYPPAPERQIDLELRRGPLTLKLNWPMTDTAGLAAWLRELLR
ncbi:transposase [Ottowia sp. GY511]|uniref:Transposase n=1 Tax=Ottowia flava TaxID=2675430 RepID=A0ABW4KXZ0_9BURK|nr:transposase [Ottowia sp. GY511]TXK31302.1 transposase [Ottowia sp. GY511]